MLVGKTGKVVIGLYIARIASPGKMVYIWNDRNSIPHSFAIRIFPNFWYFWKYSKKKLIFTILKIFWKITKIQISLSDRRMLVVIHDCVENLPEVLGSISHTDNDGMWPIESNLWMIEISWYSRILSWFCWYSEIANPCTDLQNGNWTSKCFSEAAMCPIELRSKYDVPETSKNTTHIRWSTLATGGASISTDRQNYPENSGFPAARAREDPHRAPEKFHHVESFLWSISQLLLAGFAEILLMKLSGVPNTSIFPQFFLIFFNSLRIP